jgi:hypothetical protein
VNALLLIAGLLGLVMIVVCGVAAAEIAGDRGRVPGFWLVLGIFFPLAGALVVWLLPPGTRGRIDCRWCSESIRQSARVCPHCQREQQARVPQPH